MARLPVSIAFEAILLFGQFVRELWPDGFTPDGFQSPSRRFFYLDKLIVITAEETVWLFQSPSRRFFYLDHQHVAGPEDGKEFVSIAFEAILLFGPISTIATTAASACFNRLRGDSFIWTPGHHHGSGRSAGRVSIAFEAILLFGPIDSNGTLWLTSGVSIAFEAILLFGQGLRVR